jgi:hypothetical protein
MGKANIFLIFSRRETKTENALFSNPTAYPKLCLRNSENTTLKYTYALVESKY